MGKFFAWLETRWSLATLIWNTVAAVLSFGLPAWAARTAHIFPQYSPFSWVAAGFIGLLVMALVYGLVGYAQGKIAVARFQNRIANTTAINPLDKTFERQRISIAALCPPITGIIRDKTFVDCELVGPANAIFHQCTFDRNNGQAVDAICIKTGSKPINGFGFLDCSFTRCTFYLITFMVPEEFWGDFIKYNWNGLNWITEIPQPELPQLRASDGTTHP